GGKSFMTRQRKVRDLVNELKKPKKAKLSAIRAKRKARMVELYLLYMTMSYLRGESSNFINKVCQQNGLQEKFFKLLKSKQN
uniref:hypothetical protein n=1 Tax=Staphylococcus aureus TaxID=1280 RepID=UPI0038B350F7